MSSAEVATCNVAWTPPVPCSPPGAPARRAGADRGDRAAPPIARPDRERPSAPGRLTSSLVVGTGSDRSYAYSAGDASRGPAGDSSRPPCRYQRDGRGRRAASRLPLASGSRPWRRYAWVRPRPAPQSRIEPLEAVRKKSSCAWGPRQTSPITSPLGPWPHRVTINHLFARVLGCGLRRASPRTPSEQEVLPARDVQAGGRKALMRGGRSHLSAAVATLYRSSRPTGRSSRGR